MNKLFTTIILLTVCLSSWGQTTAHLDSVLTYQFSTSKDSLLLTKSIFDKNGNIISKISPLYDIGLIGFSKVENTYNAKDSITLSISYKLGNNTWIKFGKDEYIYNTNGNKTSYIRYDWNTTTNNWQNYFKEEYTYDVKGNKASHIQYDWDATTNNWQYYYFLPKEEYSYDDKRNNTLIISSNWDSPTNNWKNGYKREYTYNANGKLTLQMGYDWDKTSTWHAAYKQENTYDANGNNTLSISYKYDNVKIIDQKTISTYDANGKLTSQMGYYRDTVTDNLIYGGKQEYTYNINGKKISNISFSWNTTTNLLENYKKQEYTYSTNGKELSITFLYWNTTTNAWQNTNKEEYTYNTDGNKTSDVFSNWNTETNTWIFGYYPYNFQVGANKIYYYYTKIITATELSEEKIKIYPNPTTDKITIQLPINQPTTITLNDLQGRTIQTINNIKEKEYTLSLSNLATGIYIVEISDGTKVYRKKIIKE